MLKRQGFSLLELVLVLVMVGVLFSLCVVGIRKTREAAMQTQTHNNLKQIVLSCHGFNDAYKNLPPAFDLPASKWLTGGMNFPASVHVYLTPFIESNPFFKDFVEAKGKGEIRNYTWAVFLAPGDPTATKDGAGIQNFPANLRVFSNKGLKTKFKANMPPLAEIEPGSASLVDSFPDGLANTILFATKYARCRDGGSRYVAAPTSKLAAFFGQNAARMSAHASDQTAAFQLYPTDADCLTSPLMAQSFSSSGISVGLADGSVRMISPTVSPRTWNMALQPNDGMKLGEDWD